jgi:hypothetical protein
MSQILRVNKIFKIKKIYYTLIYMTTINNYNSNNFILGVNPKKNMNLNNENIRINMSPSESLVDHLKRLEKESTNKINKINKNNFITNKNKGSLLTTKSLNSVVEELIDKLEKDVYTLNNQIKDFNLEKKEIIDLNNKEINRLKEIIRKMYLLVITINKSIELKQNNRTTLLEKLRRTIESNKGFLKNVDEIMLDEVKNMDYMNFKTEKKNNLKILNIIDHTKEIPVLQTVPIEQKETLIIPSNSVSTLNNFYNNLKKENNIINGKKQLIKKNNLNTSSRSRNNENNLNTSSRSRNNENNLNTSSRSRNNENNLNTSSRNSNNLNTSSRNSNNLNTSSRSSNNENNLNTSSRNSNNLNTSSRSSNNENNLNTSFRNSNNENNLNTSSRSSNNENNLNTSSRNSNNENNLNTSSRNSNNENNLNTSSRTNNNENNLNTSSRNSNNEIQNIQFNNLNEEKKNKKIEKKINSIKVSEENAKKSLNKYFL